MENALSLQEPFTALKENIPGDTKKQGAQVDLGEGDELGVIADERDDGAGEEGPDDGDGRKEDRREQRAFLEALADELEVAGAVGLCAQRVEARGQALDGGVACDVCGHGCERHGAKLCLAEVAHGEHAGHRQRVLQEKGHHERN